MIDGGSKRILDIVGRFIGREESESEKEIEREIGVYDYYLFSYHDLRQS